MNKYELTSKEIEDFAKQIYEVACAGYLDLKESTCAGMVNKFLLEKKVVNDTNLMEANVELSSIGQEFYIDTHQYNLREMNFVRSEF